MFAGTGLANREVALPDALGKASTPKDNNSAAEHNFPALSLVRLTKRVRSVCLATIGSDAEGTTESGGIYIRIANNKVHTSRERQKRESEIVVSWKLVRANGPDKTCTCYVQIQAPFSGNYGLVRYFLRWGKSQ